MRALLLAALLLAGCGGAEPCGPGARQLSDGGYAQLPVGSLTPVACERVP